VRAQAKPAATTVTGPKGLITVGVMLAALMAVLDISIVNVALTDIRSSFGTPLDQIGWVSIGYMMANVVIIPMTGWFQRRFGFRRYFTASIVMFTIASVLCGTAWSLPSLVVFRLLQGLGGGAIMPTAQMILFARYPKEEHTMAGALFGLGAVTGPLLGPTVGGYLIDLASWHWIFLVNVPIGIVAALIAWTSIEEPGWAPPKDARVDTVGIGLLAVGMASLQYALEEGHRDGWLESPLIVVLGFVAIIALVTFVVHELETPAPIVDFRVFANRTYAAGTGINFLVGVALFSGAYAFSLYCGAVMRYTALEIGRIFLAAGVIQIFVMPMIGRFGAKVDGRYLVGFGIVLVSASLFMSGSLTGTAGFWDLTYPQMLRAFGLGFVFVPLTVMSLADLPMSQRGAATGLYALTREVGGSIGTAWMGTLIDTQTKVHTEHITSHVDAYSPVAQDALATLQRGVGAGLVRPLDGALQILQMRIGFQSLVRAFNDAFVQAATVFALGFFLVFLMKRPDPSVKVDGAH
jgi:DHA2 family multidrug resistance protein